MKVRFKDKNAQVLFSGGYDLCPRAIYALELSPLERSILARTISWTVGRGEMRESSTTLAENLGAARESVSRALKRLTRLGYICGRVTPGKITSYVADFAVIAGDLDLPVVEDKATSEEAARVLDPDEEGRDRYAESLASEFSNAEEAFEVFINHFAKGCGNRKEATFALFQDWLDRGMSKEQMVAGAERYSLKVRNGWKFAGKFLEDEETVLKYCGTPKPKKLARGSGPDENRFNPAIWTLNETNGKIVAHMEGDSNVIVFDPPCMEAYEFFDANLAEAKMRGIDPFRYDWNAASARTSDTGSVYDGEIPF